MLRAVEGEGQEQDVGSGNDRGFLEEQAGQESDRQPDLKEGRDPGEEVRGRESRSRDLRGGRVHPNELKLERRPLREGESEEQPRYESRSGLAHMSTPTCAGRPGRTTRLAGRAR